MGRSLHWDTIQRSSSTSRLFHSTRGEPSKLRDIYYHRETSLFLDYSDYTTTKIALSVGLAERLTRGKSIMRFINKRASFIKVRPQPSQPTVTLRQRLCSPVTPRAGDSVPR